MIYDEFRHKWIRLTPEEWVRQHFINFLVSVKQFPRTLIAIEKKVMINGLPQRFDLLVYDRKARPLLIAEFKAPEVGISQAAFDQAFRYNSVLGAPYYLVSNGMVHFICRVDLIQRKTLFLNEIPEYEELISF